MLHKIESENQIGKHIGALLLNDIKETMMAEVSWRTGKIKCQSDNLGSYAEMVFGFKDYVLLCSHCYLEKAS